MPKAEAVVDPPVKTGEEASVIDVNSPEFKAAVKAETDKALEGSRGDIRTEERKNIDAEIQRKAQEIADAAAAGASKTTQPTDDWFAKFEEKHGIPAQAARELFAAIIGFTQKHITNDMSASQRRTELRLQRQDLRATSAKLAKFDDLYHDEVQKVIDTLKPEQIGADTYAVVFKSVLGAHTEELLDEAAKGPKKDPTEPEIVAPGPTPDASGKRKDATVEFNRDQKQFMSERALSEKDFVEMQRKRARKLETEGLDKAAVRAQIGPLLGDIDF